MIPAVDGAMTAAEVEPLTEEETTYRKEVATEMLQKWRVEKPINARRADLKEMAIHRYEDELRMIATVGQLRAENAELRGRALDDVQFRALLDLLMCSDPWPVGDKSTEIPIACFATAEAKTRGYADWIAAFHEFKPRDSFLAWLAKRKDALAILSGERDGRS